MSSIPDTPTLAMPIGLPQGGVGTDTHYQDLATKLAAEVQVDLSVRIWTDPALAYAAINPMVRSAAKFYPTGNAGPGGGVVATDTLIFSTWLWEYLSLRKNSSASAAVPALIRMGNIDQSQLQTAVQTELNANARYASWAQADKTQFVTDFLAGSAYILLDAGTQIGAGAADPSPSGSVPAGHRRIDLAFLKPDGTILDSMLYFEMWSMIGGDLVIGHPLLKALARDVMPGTAPIEGGTRIKAIGQGFTSATTVSVGANVATNLYVTPDGETVYFDAPAGVEGAADVQIDTPGDQSKLIVGGITYTSDLAETVRAVASSLVVGLGEIDQKIDTQITANAATTRIRMEAEIAVDVILNVSSGIIQKRQAASVPSFTPSAIEAARMAAAVVDVTIDKALFTILIKGV
jgi:hypothetical protein